MDQGKIFSEWKKTVKISRFAGKVKNFQPLQVARGGKILHKEGPPGKGWFGYLSVSPFPPPSPWEPSI